MCITSQAMDIFYTHGSVCNCCPPINGKPHGAPDLIHTYSASIRQPAARRTEPLGRTIFSTGNRGLKQKQLTYHKEPRSNNLSVPNKALAKLFQLATDLVIDLLPRKQTHGGPAAAQASDEGTQNPKQHQMYLGWRRCFLPPRLPRGRFFTGLGQGLGHMSSVPETSPSSQTQHTSPPSLM